MSKKFLVKKDPTMTAENVEWIQMDGSEFKAFIRLEENKERRFIPLYDDITKQVDIVIEATISEYKDWKEKYNHSYYLSQYSKDRQLLSLQSMVDEELSLSDTTPCEYGLDPADDVEEKMLAEFIETCIDELPPLEKQAILTLIECGPEATEQFCADILGWSKMNFWRRKNRALKKIFEKIEK